MKRTRRNASVFVILLVAAALSLIACSHLALPTAVPPVEEFKDLALAGSVLDVVSVETDNADFLIYKSARHGSFLGNRKLWGDALVAALSKELSKRGATILPTAATRFKVGLPEISGRSTYATVGFHAKAVVTSTAGWTKTYGGQTSAPTGDYGSQGRGSRVAERAANYTIAELVKAMLADSAFISQIKGATP